MAVWEAVILVGGTAAFMTLGFFLMRGVDGALAAGRWHVRPVGADDSREMAASGGLFLKPKAAVPYLYADQTLRQGLALLRAHGYTAVPVIARDGRYVGTLRADDVRMGAGYTVSAALRDVLREGLYPAVRMGVGVEDLSRRMTGQNFVPVTDDRGLFMGIVTRGEYPTA